MRDRQPAEQKNIKKSIDINRATCQKRSNLIKIPMTKYAEYFEGNRYNDKVASITRTNMEEKCNNRNARYRNRNEE